MSHNPNATLFPYEQAAVGRRRYKPSAREWFSYLKRRRINARLQGLVFHNRLERDEKGKVTHA